MSSHPFGGHTDLGGTPIWGLHPLGGHTNLVGTQICTLIWGAHRFGGTKLWGAWTRLATTCLQESFRACECVTPHI